MSACMLCFLIIPENSQVWFNRVVLFNHWVEIYKHKHILSSFWEISNLPMTYDMAMTSLTPRTIKAESYDSRRNPPYDKSMTRVWQGMTYDIGVFTFVYPGWNWSWNQGLQNAYDTMTPYDRPHTENYNGRIICQSVKSALWQIYDKGMTGYDIGM